MPRRRRLRAQLAVKASAGTPCRYSPVVEVESLGWRSDLMVRTLAGSLVMHAPDHVVVRTVGRSDFYWGNFILIPAGPGERDAAAWLTVFAGEFPLAQHIAIGIDGKGLPSTARPDFAAQGLAAEVNCVLTASSLVDAVELERGVEIRPIAGDGDWALVLELRLAVAREEGLDSAAHGSFLEGAVREESVLCGRRLGLYFGVFRDGSLLSSLGVVVAPDGVARFQNVETRPGYRRQGLAGWLVRHAAAHAIRHLGARLLVIVADPEGPAIGLYRRLGFTEAETQLQMVRVPSPA